jgi:hypothetical protein
MSRAKIIRYSIGATLGVFCALASKESSIVLLFGIITTAFTLHGFRDRGELKRLSYTLILIVLVSGIYFFIRAGIVESSAPSRPLSKAIVGNNAMNSCWAVFLSGKLLAIPTSSHYFWQTPAFMLNARGLSLIATILLVILFGGLSILWIFATRQRAAFPAYFLAITIATMVLVTILSTGLPFAERYVYLIGPLGLLVWLLSGYLDKHSRFPFIRSEGDRPDKFAVIAWLFIAICAAQTFQGAARYSTRIGFWSHAQNVAPDLSHPNWGLGFELYSLGRFNEALEPLERGLQLETDPAVRESVAVKLAQTHLLIDQPSMALTVLDEAERVSPEDNPNITFTRVAALAHMNRIDDARAELDRAEKLWANDSNIQEQIKRVRFNLTEQDNP